MDFPLHHLPVSELWSDFSVQTGSESLIQSLEQVFRRYSMPSGELCKYSVSYAEKSLSLIIVPHDYDRQNRIDFSMPGESDKFSFIRRSFRFSGPFVIVSSAGGIDNADLCSIIFSLSSAASAELFSLPIFVEMSNEENREFYGFCTTEKSRIVFSSNFEWILPTDLSPNSVILSLSRAFRCSPTSSRLAFRQVYSFDQSDFSNSISYSRNLYFCNITADPIQKIFIVCDSDSKFPDDCPMSASSIAIQIIRSEQSAHNTCMHSFVLKSFNFAASVGQIPEKFLDKVFSQESLDLNTVAPFKAAPKGSILCTLASELSVLRTMSNSSSLWPSFISRIRNLFAQRKPIPAVGTGKPDFKFSLAFQKLQMINFCLEILSTKNIDLAINRSESHLGNGEKIRNPFHAFVQTEDQYDDSEQIWKKVRKGAIDEANECSEKVTDAIEIFRRFNPNSEVYDFREFFFETEKLSEKAADFLNRKWQLCTLQPSLHSPQFDPNTEAEIALDYLEGLSTEEAYKAMICPLLASSYFHLHEISINCFHNLAQMIDEAIPKTISECIGDKDKLINVCNRIERAGVECETVNSLLMKFPKCMSLVESIAQNGCAAVSSEGERDAVQSFLDSVGFDKKADFCTFSKDFRAEVDLNSDKGRTEVDIRVSDLNDSVVIARSVIEHCACSSIIDGIHVCQTVSLSDYQKEPSNSN